MDKKIIPSIIFSLLLLFSGCINPMTDRKKTSKSPIKVKVEKIELSEVNSEKNYVGKVESASRFTLKAPFPGELKELKIQQGEKVKKGQELAYIHSENVENVFISSKATLEQAEDGYERIQKVKDNGSVSQVKIVEVETQLAQARAAYNSAKKAKEDCMIKSPCDGTISAVLVNEGESLDLLRPIMEIVDLNHLEIVISVPETEILSYKKGDKACALIPAISQDIFEAELIEKGVEASLLSHSYQCRLSISGVPEGPMPGMIGKIIFKTESKPMPVIAASVIMSDNAGKYVWIVNSLGKVEKRRITTGGFSGKGVIITDGLSQGDMLIIEGISKVSTGMTVTY